MQRTISPDSIAWTELGKGQRRKVCAFNDQEMLVQVNFDAGSVGAMHKHPHTQISYVLEGEFLYYIGEDTYKLKQGDSIVVNSDEVHGCTCVTAGTLLDIFAPMRKDFV